MALARQLRWDAGGIRVLSEEALVPVPSQPLLRGSCDPAMRRGDRLGGADQSPSNDPPADTVLTQGSGGVSVFALQFAHVLGRPE